MRDQLFISYAHEDKSWLDRFAEMLAPAMRQRRVAWTDQQLQPGSNWRADIDAALQRARAALLLVSPSFFDSDFITNVELPALLAANERKELALFWVSLSASMYEQTPLAALQAAAAPDSPLDAMTEAQADAAIKQVCVRMMAQLGPVPFMTHDERDDFRQRVSAKIAPRYEITDELDTGDSSIVYRARAQSFDQVVAVKALVSSVLQRGVEQRFRAAIELAHRFRSPAFIRVLNDFLDGAPHCVVMDYVDGQTLDEFLQSGTPLPLRQIRALLLRLAEALAEAHGYDCLLQGLTPKNIRLDARHEPRISAFRFFNLISDAGSPGTLLVSHECCTYLTPEQFEGQERTHASDQYALGMIGYELLTGRRLPPVTRAADFVGRPGLFAELEKDERIGQRSPELGGIVARMLRVDPDQRWQSMDEVARALDGLTIANSRAEELRDLAAKSYLRIQASLVSEQRFYEKFYAGLFERLPDVRGFFPASPKAMEGQYEALNKAIKVLLDFDPACADSARALERIARSHDRYKLTDQHLQAFHAALLDTLAAQGERDPAVHGAWDEVVRGGLGALGKLLAR